MLGTAGAWAQDAGTDADTTATGTVVRVAGYNKTLLMGSRTFDAAAERYTLGLNRTRLKLTVLRSPGFELQVENDTELRLGDYLDTAQDRAETAAPSPLYADLRSQLADGSQARLTNDFFRAYVKLSGGDTDLWIGRQRVALGTGRLWSTLDLLNPVNPLQVEREELVGVDAVRVEQRLDPLSKAGAVVAPQPGGGSPRWVAFYRSHLGEADVTGTLLRSRGEESAGVDVATQAGGLGVRGELTFTRPNLGGTYRSALLGLDYAFENTLTVSFEAYLSSQPPELRRQQVLAEPQRAQVQPVDTRYLGAMGSYEFTPLVKATLVLLSNRRDHSRFASAALAWSVREDWVVQAGVQRFSGASDSEYGRGQAFNYLQAQWFF